jgi:Tol biopolymer transport system component
MLAYAATPRGLWANDWDIMVTQPGGDPVNRTADHTGRDLFPSWSPDGAQIAFWSDRDGGGCYVMPAVAGAARRVAPASENPNAPSWSSDGRNCPACLATSTRLPRHRSIATGEPLRQLRLATPFAGPQTFVAPAPDGRRVHGRGLWRLFADLSRLVLVDRDGTGDAAY